MPQVNAALHCLLPCWYREAPHGEPPPAASRAGGGHPAGPLALRHVDNPALRSDTVKRPNGADDSGAAPFRQQASRCGHDCYRQLAASAP